MKMTNRTVAATIVTLVTSYVGGAFANERELLLSGPVDAIDTQANSVVVMGRIVETIDAYRVVVGQRINVYGTLEKDGSIGDALLESITTYVPGADPVYVKGVVTQSDSSTGVVQVGAVRVDYTSLLSLTGFAAPSVGDTVEFAGTQPASGGVVLATISNGGGFRSAISNGGGIDRQISNGGGIDRQISNGGGRASN